MKITEDKSGFISSSKIISFDYTPYNTSCEACTIFNLHKM